MQTLKFAGYSDDTFGEYNVTRTDYDNCANGKPITFKVTAEDKSIYVTGRYNLHRNGCWGIEIAPGAEDESPDWPMRVTIMGYSSVLEIDIPDGARVHVEHIEEQPNAE